MGLVLAKCFLGPGMTCSRLPLALALGGLPGSAQAVPTPRRAAPRCPGPRAGPWAFSSCSPRARASFCSGTGVLLLRTHVCSMKTASKSYGPKTTLGRASRARL